MEKLTKLKGILGIPLVILVLCALLMPAAMPVLAASYPLSTNDARIMAALDYLEDCQNVDGSIGSNVEMCCYAIVAIDAGGRDTHSYSKGGNSVVDYIRSKATFEAQPPETKEALPYEYYLSAIVAAGENPWDFGGVNFVGGLKAMFDGEQIGKPGLINDDFWGIIALIGAGESRSSEIIQASKNYILANQSDAGGWGCTTAGAGDVCDTANAIMALIAAGQSPSSRAIQDGLDFIKSEQLDDGGFPCAGMSDKSDVASDARAIAAIRACGQDPTGEHWTKNGNNPVEHALSLQRADGGFNWIEGVDNNPEWMTSYILPPLVGKYWPTKIVKDNSSPKISDLEPSSGATVDTGKPTISAAYSDALSGIDSSSVTLRVDGADVTSETTVTETGISYIPTTALSDGTRSAQLTVYDQAGNKAYKAWSFIVDTETASDTTPPTISNLSPPSGATVDTGTPTISAAYSDTGSGIDTASVSVKIDSTLVEAIITGTRASYTPAIPLANSEHRIEVRVRDIEGNQARRAWSFRVEAGLPPGVIELTGKIDASGRVLELVELASADKKVDLKLPERTIALTVSGTPPEQITIEAVTESPSVSPDVCPIGLTYDIGPEKATFEPPITLTLHYDEVPVADSMAWDVNCDGSVNVADIVKVTSPDWKGVTEEDFKIAYFDTSKNEWAILENSVADIAENTVTARVRHFTQFTILGGTTSSSSAAFTVKSLDVTPEVVRPGEDVTVTVLVANTGETEGSYSLSLKIGGGVETVEELILTPGEERLVTFTVSRENAGSYEVEVDGQTAEFTVEETVPPEDTGSLDWAFWAFIGSIVAGILAITAIIIFILGRRRGRT